MCCFFTAIGIRAVLLASSSLNLVIRVIPIVSTNDSMPRNWCNPDAFRRTTMFVSTSIERMSATQIHKTSTSCILITDIQCVLFSFARLNCTWKGIVDDLYPGSYAWNRPCSAPPPLPPGPGAAPAAVRGQARGGAAGSSGEAGPAPRSVSDW